MKAGKSAPKSGSKPSVILHLNTDWMIITDLKDGYVVPGHIALSALRPDIVLKFTKTCSYWNLLALVKRTWHLGTLPKLPSIPALLMPWNQMVGMSTFLLLRWGPVATALDLLQPV